MKGYWRLCVMILAAGLCASMIAACGGGEGSDTVELCIQEWDDWTRTSPASPPTSSDLLGTYDLVGFLVDYYLDGAYQGYID